MTQSDVNKQLLSKDNCLYAVGIVILTVVALVVRHYAGWALSIWWKETAVTFGCLAPSVWDSLGFFLTQDRDDDISLNRTRYRLIQFLSQWILCFLLVLLLSNLWVTLGCMLCWWLGGFDLLFYLLRREPKQYNMTWLKWTLPGILYGGKPESWGMFFAWAWVGYCVAIGSAFIN